MAMRRVVGQQILNRQKSGGGNFPSLKEILVDLKPDPATGVTVRTLRLVGCPIEVREYNDKRRDPNDPKKRISVPFPDAHLTKAITRIGHDDEDQCPWKKLGYIPQTKYAINCLERQKDGSSVVKVLYKGVSIFSAFGKIEQDNRELNAENDDDSLCTFLGGLVAHDVRIKATANPQKLGGVEYSVSVNPKPSKLTDEEIEMLRKVYEPSAEDLAKFRKEWNEDRKNNPEMPEWQDWYEFGHNLRQIYKHTPIKSESGEQTATSADLDIDASLPEGGDNDAEETPAAPPKAAGKGKAKAAPAPAPEADDEPESLASPFADEEFDEEGDDSGPNW